jgi:protease-4
MSSRLDSDAIYALRRLRRHLTWWRVLTVIGFTLAILANLNARDLKFDGDHVARVEITGIIVDDPDFIWMLDEIADDPHVKALLLDIDSPGGTFTGSESVFDALRRVAEVKPVVAVMGGMATSGAYMSAVAADRIYAGRGTITGSIGVIMETADVTDLMEKIGVTPEIIKSGDLKATPNPSETLSDAARAQLQGVIDELHLAFMETVAERRNLSLDEVRARTGDGRIMTGPTAMQAGLLDEIGNADAARAWLAAEKGIDANLPQEEWYLEEDYDWLRAGASTVSRAIFGKSLLPESLRLDGILALWHPSISGGR